MPTRAPYTLRMEQDVSAVQGGVAYWSDLERRLAPYCERSEPRQRAMAARRGLRSPAERKHSWPVAEVSGDPTPYAVQQLRRRALWDPAAVRDELRAYVIQHWGDPHGVLVLDETGVLNTGHHSAGVARQDSGTAGTVEHGQIGVFLGDASQLGHALLDRELYLPEEWTNDRTRCQQAGIPDDRRFLTKPQLAREMLARAFAAGIPAQWVTGDRVYGADRRRRMWWEAQPQADVLAVSGQESVWLGWQPRQVQPMLAALPEDGWTRLRAGDGTKGPRGYDGCWLPLAEPLAPHWRRWLVVRRRLSDPTDVTAAVVVAPQATSLEAVVRVAGRRWTIASSFEAAQGEVGLDDYEVRSGTGGYRPLTLAMWAYALLTGLRAGAMAVEALKKSPPVSPRRSRLATFKAGRGLASR